MKTVSIRLDEKLLERLNHFKELEPSGATSQSDFIIKAIEEKIERVKSQRSGDLELCIPNPQRIASTEKQKVDAILTLSKFANELNKNCVGLDFGTDYVTAYAKQRLITDHDDFKRKLEENFYNDLEFENSL